MPSTSQSEREFQISFNKNYSCKVKPIHYILKNMQVKSFGHSRTGKRR